MRFMEMFMEDFKVGDVVQLKSGGPKMTVNNADPSPTSTDGIAIPSSPRTIYCQWFAGSKLESGSFKPESITLVSAESGG